MNICPRFNYYSWKWVLEKYKNYYWERTDKSKKIDALREKAVIDESEGKIEFNGFKSKKSEILSNMVNISLNGNFIGFTKIFDPMRVIKIETLILHKTIFMIQKLKSEMYNLMVTKEIAFLKILTDWIKNRNENL